MVVVAATPLPVGDIAAVMIAQLCEAYQATVLFPFIVFMVESFRAGEDASTLGTGTQLQMCGTSECVVAGLERLCCYCRVGHRHLRRRIGSSVLSGTVFDVSDMGMWRGVATSFGTPHEHTIS